MSYIRPPRYGKGPRTRQDLKEHLELVVTKPFLFALWLVACAGGISFVGANSWIRGLLFWSCAAAFILGVYYLGCSDARQSLVRLPWYKPWAILLLLATLPLAIVWLASLVRLIISDPSKSVWRKPHQL